jgi:hypothetical protein
MKNSFLALRGKLTNVQVRARMLFVSAIVVMLCGILAAVQIGPVEGVVLATLMSVPLLPFSHTLCLGANAGLTTLLPVVVQALDVVSRELIGFIPGVNRDPKADRLAKNQTLYSWVTPTIALTDIAPGATVPQPADRTLGNKSISIDNFKAAPFYFTGEEEMQLNTSGSYGGVIADTIEQAVRTVTNQIESDIALAAQVGASRAYGTAGVTPFPTTVGDSAQTRKILDDNGAPMGTRSLVIDTTTGAALRTLANLTKANEAGTTMGLRDGALLDLNGQVIRESAQVVTPTAGTMASATSTSAAFTVGQTVIPLAAAGTGTVAAGDIVTFANDTNKYVVAAVSFAGANPASGDSITLAAPGLRKAQGVATRAITVIASGPRMIAHSRNAILLATRLPARPSGGDLATDIAVITDARSGISLELSMYPQYRQVYYEIAAAWGVRVIKPEHIAVLLG